MIKVNVAQARAHLSAYLDRAGAGEVVVVSRRNVPVAEIRAVPQRSREPRPLGIDRGMVIPASFYEPPPDELLDSFE